MSDEFQEQQRALAEQHQVVLEARLEWAEAKGREDIAARELAYKRNAVLNANDKVEAATEALLELLITEPHFDTQEDLARKVNRMSRDFNKKHRASHVGSSNQGKSSTHR